METGARELTRESASANDRGRPTSRTTVALRCAGALAVGLGLGFAELVVYALLTFDSTFMCSGGLAEADGTALVIGIALWCALGVAIAVVRTRLGMLLAAYAVAYAASLILLVALAEVIWGPTDCGPGF